MCEQGLAVFRRQVAAGAQRLDRRHHARIHRQGLGIAPHALQCAREIAQALHRVRMLLAQQLCSRFEGGAMQFQRFGQAALQSVGLGQVVARRQRGEAVLADVGDVARQHPLAQWHRLVVLPQRLVHAGQEAVKIDRLAVGSGEQFAGQAQRLFEQRKRIGRAVHRQIGRTERGHDVHRIARALAVFFQGFAVVQFLDRQCLGVAPERRIAGRNHAHRTQGADVVRPIRRGVEFEFFLVQRQRLGLAAAKEIPVGDIVEQVERIGVLLAARLDRQAQRLLQQRQLLFILAEVVETDRHRAQRMDRVRMLLALVLHAQRQQLLVDGERILVTRQFVVNVRQRLQRGPGVGIAFAACGHAQLDQLLRHRQGFLRADLRQRVDQVGARAQRIGMALALRRFVQAQRLFVQRHGGGVVIAVEGERAATVQLSGFGGVLC